MKTKFFRYGFLQFGIVGVMLYFLIPFFLPLWLKFTNDVSMILHLSENTLVYTLYGIVFALWGFFFLQYIFQTHYYFRTRGRNYSADHAKYQLGLLELLDYFKDWRPQQIMPEDLPAENWKTADGIILGHIGKHLMKRDSDGVGNLALFALPGDGKTTSQMIPTALRFGGSVLVIDIKGVFFTGQKKNEK